MKDEENLSLNADIHSLSAQIILVGFRRKVDGRNTEKIYKDIIDMTDIISLQKNMYP